MRDETPPLFAQHVTWNKPIMLPSASFQTRITSDMGNNSTWHFFRLK